MRVLAFTSAGLAHLFPLVPSLWAARAAGAQVVVGATGAAVTGAAGAGLPSVDLAPGREDELAALRRGFLARMPGAADDDERFALAMELFATLADEVADRALALGRAVAPDLVIHTPLAPVGPLVAAALDVPVVEHGFQLTGVRRTQHLLAPHLAAACAREGVPALRPLDAALDVCPPSMRPPGPTGTALRFLPYGGGRALDVAALSGRGTRTHPRVLVTLGTSDEHLDAVAPVVAACRRRGADVVLTGAAPADLDPAVEVHPWLPLDTALADVDALVHHGGAGTTLSALAAGVPQVVVSRHADHAFNADALVRRGVGASAAPARPGAPPEPDALDGALQGVLGTPEVRGAAREVAAEIRALPTPSALVPALLDALVTATPASASDPSDAAPHPFSPARRAQEVA